MISTDADISQSKIVETSQFVFKPITIGLLIEKYYDWIDQDMIE